jgi:hypothetical protein
MRNKKIAKLLAAVITTLLIISIAIVFAHPYNAITEKEDKGNYEDHEECEEIMEQMHDECSDMMREMHQYNQTDGMPEENTEDYEQRNGHGCH